MDIQEKEKTKNNIAITYSKIIAEIAENFKYGVPYRLDFIDDYSQKSLASCWYEKKLISVSLKTLFDTSIKFTLIHELAHAICEEFNLRRKHDLEFAIINYALQYRICYKHLKEFDPIPTFLNSYDIHEDEYFEKLHINTYRFNKMITEIKYKTITELVDFAVSKSSDIRNKFRN